VVSQETSVSYLLTIGTMINMVLWYPLVKYIIDLLNKLVVIYFAKLVKTVNAFSIIGKDRRQVSCGKLQVKIANDWFTALVA
jgi:TctA family transporter